MVPITHCSRREQPVVVVIDGQIILNSGISVTWQPLCSVVKKSSLFLLFIGLAILIGEKFLRAQVPLQLIAISTPAGRTIWIYHYLYKSDTHTKNPKSTIADVHEQSVRNIRNGQVN